MTDLEQDVSVRDTVVSKVECIKRLLKYLQNVSTD